MTIPWQTVVNMNNGVYYVCVVEDQNPGYVDSELLSMT